jgi:hypothetical protein
MKTQTANDTHGATVRKGMMRSMSHPAKPATYKSTNVRDPQFVRSSSLLAFFVLVLTLGVTAVLLLNRLEQPFRPTPITNDVTPEVRYDNTH